MGHYKNSPELEKIFRLSSVDGTETSGINTALMIDMAKNSKPMTNKDFNELVKQHKLFLKNGGIKGKFETLLVAELVLAIYSNQNVKEGTQLNISMHNISKIKLHTLQLPCTNAVGIYCPGKDMSETDFSNSVFTDSFFDQTIFNNSNLSKSDFSRSSMVGCSFRNCDLSGCDFENCNLTGADFRSANLANARFPGAILKNIIY